VIFRSCIFWWMEYIFFVLIFFLSYVLNKYKKEVLYHTEKLPNIG
jgi:preprotein translocase subunit SecG